ncbi:MAG: helix-turn-helix domain-containing protein [Clostridia bacterium]|nr:helix-turn-helix domain-containing protein [Clostridia bacterium]
MNSTVFSENLKKFRTAKNLTQEQAAEALHVNAQTVSRWECGTTLPDVMLLPEIARLYEVTVDDFYRKHSVAYDNYAQRLSSVYEKTRDPEDFLRCLLEYKKLMKEGELSLADKWNFAIIHDFMLDYCKDTAMEWYDKTLACDPSEDEHSYRRAASCREGLFFTLGRGEEFIAEQIKKVDRTPDNPLEWSLLIEAYMEASKYEDAYEWFKKASSRFPEEWVLYIHGGEICEHLENYDEAFALWDKAGELGTYFWDELYCKAFCYEKLGNYEKALEIRREISAQLRANGYDVEAEMNENWMQRIQAKME